MNNCLNLNKQKREKKKHKKKRNNDDLLYVSFHLHYELAF